jgi:hypothetical protein
MTHQTIEQIKNEVFELTNKIESVKENLSVLEKQESQKVKIDFETFMEWADNYFERKDNSRSMGNDLSSEIDIDDYCRVELSLEYGNEIQIEKEWTDTDDIVEKVFDLAREDFKNFMLQEYENKSMFDKEIENNL